MLNHFGFPSLLIIIKENSNSFILPLQNGLTDNLPKLADSGYESNAKNHL